MAGSAAGDFSVRVDPRRVDGQMRRNGVRTIHSPKDKRTTDTDHTFNIAANPLPQDIPTIGHRDPNFAHDDQLTCPGDSGLKRLPLSFKRKPALPQ
jgi:hypothetical protein